RADPGAGRRSGPRARRCVGGLVVGQRGRRGGGLRGHLVRSQKRPPRQPGRSRTRPAGPHSLNRTDTRTSGLSNVAPGASAFFFGAAFVLAALLVFVDDVFFLGEG